MIFSEKHIEGLNVVLNEASIEELHFNEVDNIFSCKLELIREKGSEIPNVIILKLEKIKRYISRYTSDFQNSKTVIHFPHYEIENYLKNFINKEIYGWCFFNVKDSVFNLEELSFDYLKSDNFNNFNSLELFQEGFDEDLEIKIWFENIRILDVNDLELNINHLIDKQNKVWNSIFKPSVSDIRSIFVIPKFLNVAILRCVNYFFKK